jgi:sulfatase maturation enzyme AslB (radical SAM superfamily)
VQGVLRLVEKHRPIQVSLVGGDPLVRYRELEELLPELDRRGIWVQLVTSAFRPIPVRWNHLSGLHIVVSVDGLPAEHDVRRKPATYDRILKNIAGTKITVHCTVTSQMTHRAGYLEEFVRFWSERPETKRIWISLFTPQQGATDPEILAPDQRRRVVEDLFRLRTMYPLMHMPARVIKEFMHPPASPEECIFARTTLPVSADLKSKITPCQFGGTPDCSQCGCLASMGLAAVGHIRIMPGVSAGQLFRLSELVGSGVDRLRSSNMPQDTARPAGLIPHEDAA